MVITQLLYDEMIKNSSNIDGILVIPPISRIIPAAYVRAKHLISKNRFNNDVHYQMLCPYRPIYHFHHQRNHHNWYLDVYVLLMDGKLHLRRITILLKPYIITARVGVSTLY